MGPRLETSNTPGRVVIFHDVKTLPNATDAPCQGKTPSTQECPSLLLHRITIFIYMNSTIWTTFQDLIYELNSLKAKLRKQKLQSRLIELRIVCLQFKKSAIRKIINIVRAFAKLNVL